MGFDRARIKENAKKHYQINKWNNVVVALIMGVAAGGSGAINSYSNSSSSSSSSSSVPDEISGAVAAAAIAVAIFALIAGLIGIAVAYFLANPIKLGGAGWFQKSIHYESLPVGEMFKPFKVNYLNNVLTMFLRDLFVGLWSLLFIIPGIVKGYSYSMTEYIKYENPDLPPKKAIELSGKMTDGHKMDLFMLEMSFLGWSLLSLLTLGILAILYVNPYYNAAKAFAYEELKAEALASGKISAEELGGNNMEM